MVILGSYIFGDLFSGIVHWATDNYGSRSTPIFGSVIEAFQGHHAAPWTITFRPFANNVFKIAYGVIAGTALTLFGISKAYISPTAGLFIILFLLSTG